ncbi:MAG TPA: hypothetical protein VFL98_01785 [Candidatus Paceibacterota bacterium]|nr:hypothetical protein [Candidatus Paceibacterota bacterium]
MNPENEDAFERMLDRLDLPEADPARHREQLKAALLDAHPSNRTTMTPFPTRIFIPAGAFALAVVIAIGAAYSLGTQPTYASALADKSMHAVLQLPETAKHALDMHLQTQAESLLAEANGAKDLTVLSPEQVTGLLYPSTWMDQLTDDERAAFAARLASQDLAGAQFLQFTDADGQKVIIAVNDADLPVYQLSGVGTKGADEAAGIRALVENFGQELKFVSLLSPTAGTDMETRYAAYVSPDLLASWKADPEHAFGRLTSSPWPEGIVVTGMQKTADDTYTVTGDILDVTSAEITENAAMARPVTLTVKAVDGHWQITAVSAQEE